MRIFLLALPALLLGCGGGSGGGSSNDPAMPPTAQAPATRYDMANACFVVRETGSGQFLRANDNGSVELVSGTPSEATPFFMKPSALGRYLFFDPRSRFLSLPAENDALADLAATILENLGWEIAHVGDALLYAPPQLDPLGNTIDQLGDTVAGQAPQTDQFRGARSLAMTAEPSDASEWTIEDETDAEGTGQFTIASTLTGDQLGSAQGAGSFEFLPSTGCTEFPEAELNATGEPFKGRNPDGTVFGYAETHMHLGGSEALGGRLGYGSPFHRFGITHALGNCEGDHGPNGVLDALDAVVNPPKNFFPPHETVGWPSYKDWPSWGGQTHHQTYYLWLQRAWMGGLRLMMNHLVANEEICQLWPLAEHDCNEMQSIALQRQLVLDLQDYIDAQSGGPGKGFFRIVYDPSEARRVIEDGKLAVILGTENEKIFDCGEYLDAPLCTREHIDEQLDQWHALGLRAIFPIHLLDNAFGGTRLTDDPALSALYQAANIVATGHPYATIPCDQLDAQAPHGATPVDESRGIFDTVLLQLMGPPPVPPLTGCVRNARGLTELGDYFINAMIDRGIMIETDHTGEIARRRMFDIAAARGVPVLSGHTGEISEVKDSRRILEIGGVISNLPDEPSPVTVDFIQDLIALYREVHGTTDGLGTGMGADINGIHNQPPPRANAAEEPLQYPFKSYDGKVTFERQVTGERVFDINTDGVAHYGLYPDFIADMQMQPGGPEALEYVFRSAEAYLQAWERAHAKRIPID
jgi:microsomal dipeptidase-like Zn-dependent dipeptidase